MKTTQQSFRSGTLPTLDYTHIGGNGLPRNEKLANSCQTCGCASVELVCERCKSLEPQYGSAVKKTGWEQLMKRVTVAGLKVLVNGEVVAEARNLMELEVKRRYFSEKYVHHNAECLRGMGRRV